VGRLWDALDGREAAAAARALEIAGDGWVAHTQAAVIASYAAMAQAETLRFCAGRALLHDYYAAAEGGIISDPTGSAAAAAVAAAADAAAAAAEAAAASLSPDVGGRGGRGKSVAGGQSVMSNKPLSIAGALGAVRPGAASVAMSIAPDAARKAPNPSGGKASVAGKGKGQGAC
jgi:hypothetical protein